MTKKKAKMEEVIICLVLVVIGIALVIAAQRIQTGVTMGQGGDFMPKLCSNLWLLISVLLFLMTTQKPEEGFVIKGAVQIQGFLATLAMLILYAIALRVIGFVICSIIYMFVQMFIFVPQDLRSKKMYVIFTIISIVLPITVNLLFVNVFSLVLPVGILK